MTSEKKLTVIRIVIFVILANLPGILIALIWGDKIMSGGLQIAVYMFSLAIANVLTRFITKEGFRKSYLRGNFKGNMKYYLGGIAFAVVSSVMTVFVIVAAYHNYVKFSDISVDITSISITLFYIASSVTLFWLPMGEEFGWRAYLTPKLEEIMPEWAALVVSGIIWRLWHAPAIYYGLNFGTDYKGYPYAGYAFMCVSCIFYGCVLTYLTKKTGSVYPAAICHGCVDSMTIPQLVLPDFESVYYTDSFLTALLYMLMHIIIGAVFFVILIKNKPKQLNPQ